MGFPLWSRAINQSSHGQGCVPEVDLSSIRGINEYLPATLYRISITNILLHAAFLYKIIVSFNFNFRGENHRYGLNM